MGKQSNDLGLYDRHAADWWNPRSHAFRSLHRINGFRVQLLEQWLGREWKGARVVDLGCGGGLLSDALGRRGARVLGIDRSLASLRAGLEHERALPGANCAYACGDLLRSPLRPGCARVVLLADVLEHLADWSSALVEAARLLTPGGKLYVSTINRTWRARFLAVTLAEGLGLVPRGTHDPRMFIPPAQLVDQAEACGLRLLGIQGESARILRTLRARAIDLGFSNDTSVTYSALFEKGVLP